MKTYIFVEKNGNAVVTLSADDKVEAKKSLKEVVKYPEAFRLDGVGDENE